MALSRKGRVVVLEGSTSRAVRVLAQLPMDGGRELRGISLTPDRQTVYFGYGSRYSWCDTTVFRVRVDGRGSPEKVAEGYVPELSPDSRLLAYAAGASRFGGDDAPCSNVLVVRDVTTGAERAWLPPAEDNFFDVGSITAITWAPDSKRLALEFEYEGSGIYLVDAMRPGGRMGDLEPLPDGEIAPAWRADGRILVGSYCCYPEFEKPRRTLLVDPDTGQAARFGGAESAFSRDFDSTGRHLLYVKEGDKGELFRMTDREKPVFMARDFLEADW